LGRHLELLQLAAQSPTVDQVHCLFMPLLLIRSDFLLEPVDLIDYRAYLCRLGIASLSQGTQSFPLRPNLLSDGSVRFGRRLPHVLKLLNLTIVETQCRLQRFDRPLLAGPHSLLIRCHLANQHAGQGYRNHWY